jgi:RHS repeat-associated protein
LFTGKERDPDMGIVYFGARFYQDPIARFYTPDWSANPEPVPYSKLDHPQSLNLYTFVENNPTSLRDLDGHYLEPAAAAGVRLYTSMTGGDIIAAQVKHDQEQGQRQNGSSNGRSFWSHLGQRFHNFFHGQGFITNMELPSSVTTEQGPMTPKEPNLGITAATDTVNLGALAAPKIADQIPLLGYTMAGVSIWNDPSNKNIENDAIGVIAPTATPTLVFLDIFDYVANNSTPGPVKAYGMGGNQELGDTLPTTDGGCQAAGLGAC